MLFSVELSLASDYWHAIVHMTSTTPVFRSEKLKPFWLSISEEDLSTLHTLSDAMLTKDPSPEYREAVGRGLDIPTSKVVPFFGGFLRELKAILTGVPSIIVLPSEENQLLEVSILKPVVWRVPWNQLFWGKYIDTSHFEENIFTPLTLGEYIDTSYLRKISWHH